MSLQHRREDQAVEHDVILTDEVDESCVGILPPFLPRAPLLWLSVAELLCVTDIADRCIEPNIEHLTLSTLHRHGDTPVEVTRHGTRLQIHVEPALALSVDVRAPLFVTLEDPLLQPVLILVQRQVPVLCLADLRLGTTDRGVRVDELHWGEVAAAFLTLVAISIRVAAVRARTHDVTVSEELLSLGIVILLRLFLHELAVVVELAEEVRGELVVNLRGRTTVDIEGDTKLLEGVFDELVITVADILRCHAFFLGADGDRHTVLITSADKDDGLFLQAQVAHVDISRHIHAGKVTDMHAAVGIRQGSCDCGPFKMFLFHYLMNYCAKLQNNQRFSFFSVRKSHIRSR